MPDALSSLNERQRRFVAEYVVDGNGTQAAIRAGYKATTANEQASRLLTQHNIQLAIEEARSKLQVRTDVTQDRVLRELALIAFSDVRHFKVGEGGKLVLAEGAPDEAWRAVSSVDYQLNPVLGTVEKVKLRLWSKTTALELAGKHLAMWAEKVVLADISALTDEQLARAVAREAAGESLEAALREELRAAGLSPVN